VVVRLAGLAAERRGMPGNRIVREDHAVNVVDAVVVGSGIPVEIGG
jgi:hypothetical protein